MKYLLLITFLLALPVHAAERNASVARQFRKTHACPATGQIQASCPGYVIDHIVPLCAGGPDSVENMMWQSVADSYRKDALERDICRRLAACTKK